MPLDAYNEISLLLDRIGDQLDNVPAACLDDADLGAMNEARDLLRKAETALAPVAGRYGEWEPD